MDLTRFNDFSFLTVLAGGLLFITGLLYKLKPQTKMHRFGAMQLKTARRSVEIWKEAIQFAATPITVAGCCWPVWDYCQFSSPVFGASRFHRP